MGAALSFLFSSAPTSFEGPFGKISYRIRAVIDTSRFSKDYKAQKPFYLLNLLNLNEVPDIEVRVGGGTCQGHTPFNHPTAALTTVLAPSVLVSAVMTRKFTYLLVKTGTLMLKARSDLRGYTPGQVIKLSTEIHNKSGKDTGYVLASLIQVGELTYMLGEGATHLNLPTCWRRGQHT
ncbi:hypothetical protein JZ751_028901 [Albula glossodonta]|uniref:Arrestin C-terminal-like domain-containing protein n=1 Tax=Albula glossodonta TaxID=121402 RepID=A0A8T2NA66_9TELE|nr:hypothetical protein JZ751_028901 [Albula glossodonta]